MRFDVNNMRDIPSPESETSGSWSKKAKVNRIGHRLATGRVQMQPIVGINARAILRPELRLVCRIAPGGVEIDHAVEKRVRAEPRVDELPLLLVESRVIRVSTKRRDGRAAGPDAARFGLVGELRVSVHQVR